MYRSHGAKEMVITQKPEPSRISSDFKKMLSYKPPLPEPAKKLTPTAEETDLNSDDELDNVRKPSIKAFNVGALRRQKLFELARRSLLERASLVSASQRTTEVGNRFSIMTRP